MHESPVETPAELEGKSTPRACPRFIPSRELERNFNKIINARFRDEEPARIT